MALSSRDPRAGSAPATKKKVTLYFHSTVLSETQREAIRQDRSISWVIQAAWRLAREEIRKLPAVAGTPVSPDADVLPLTPAPARPLPPR